MLHYLFVASLLCSRLQLLHLLFLRHYTISSRFPLFNYLFIASPLCSRFRLFHLLFAVAETWRRVWGGGKFFRRTFNFSMTLFWEKFPFSQQKFLMTSFLVIDQISQIFPFFSQILPVFAMLNVIFDPFLKRKTHFFTLFILSRASDITTSLNI